MNRGLIFKTFGFLILLLALVQVIPLATSYYYQSPDFVAFAISMSISFVLGAVLYLMFRKQEGNLRLREACILVGGTWVLMTVFGALPFYLSGEIPRVVDAWFEAASGFTTTGATVVTEIEALSPGILIWRSLMQFLGGMGIIVLSLAILPLLGVGGMDLYRAEATGPVSDKISARISETARALWGLYFIFTLVAMITYWLLGMTFFDAVNHGLTSIATGGFSTKNASFAAFDSVWLECAAIVFMFIGGVSFLLHYRLIIRGDLNVFRDREFRFYVMLLFSAAILIAYATWGSHYQTFYQALRNSAFQVVSIGTSTGYVSADYLLWGPFAQLIIVILMVTGACAGSTSGGIKCIRAMMLIKQGYRELFKVIHPKAVVPLKKDGKNVPDHISSAIFGFFFLYIVLLIVTSLFLTATGIDLVTAISATISALSNIGPALGEAGPMSNYGSLPDLAKWLLGACMIVGRLEIFTLLVLLMPAFWRN